MVHKAIFLWVVGLFLCSTSAKLQDGPWPMFHHDLKHTGRSSYVGPETPTLKWTFSTGAPIHSSAAVGADGTIYVGCCDAVLYALNPDGTLRWSFLTGGSLLSSPAIGTDGTVYVGSVDDSSLYAIDSAGGFKWRYPTGHHVYSSPAIAPDGTIYIGSCDGNLYAVNPDGTLKWSYPTEGEVYSSPAVGADGTLYVGSDDHHLYAINPDGTLKWRFPTEGTIRASPAIASDGTIYINPDLETVGFYAINPDGHLKWICDTLGLYFGQPSMIFTSSPAIDREGTIYVGSNWPRALCAINPDGTLKWMCPITDPSQSSPAVDANRTIYIGSSSWHLYAVDSTGTIKWDFPTLANAANSPAVDDRRTVYIGTWGTAFLAVGFLRDVSPISITSPGDSVYIDSTYYPEVVVKNLGDTLETFDVACMIDTAGQSVYGDTSTVLDLPVGDTALVSFDGWTVGPAPGVSYTVTVVTLLDPDDRPANDSLSKVTVSIPLPGVEELNSQLPMANCQLFQSWPNPFSRNTAISYQLSAPGYVTLGVYDLSGKMVRSLADGRQSPGHYTIVWDGRDSSGRPVASGIYFYRLAVPHTDGEQAGAFTATKKLAVVR